MIRVKVCRVFSTDIPEYVERLDVVDIQLPTVLLLRLTAALTAIAIPSAGQIPLLSPVGSVVFRAPANPIWMALTSIQCCLARTAAKAARGLFNSEAGTPDFLATVGARNEDRLLAPFPDRVSVRPLVLRTPFAVALLATEVVFVTLQIKRRKAQCRSTSRAGDINAISTHRYLALFRADVPAPLDLILVAIDGDAALEACRVRLGLHSGLLLRVWRAVVRAVQPAPGRSLIVPFSLSR